MWQTLAEWCSYSVVGVTVRDSLWLFPAIEGVHLLAMALLGGTLVVVDLRLWGLGIRGQSAEALEREIRPWMLAGLTGMLASGALLFMSEAIGYSENLMFRAKMLALVPALVFTVGLKPMAIPRAGWRGRRGLALLSLFLWFVVGVTGRGIGFW